MARHIRNRASRRACAKYPRSHPNVPHAIVHRIKLPRVSVRGTFLEVCCDHVSIASEYRPCSIQGQPSWARRLLYGVWLLVWAKTAATRRAQLALPPPSARTASDASIALSVRKTLANVNKTGTIESSQQSLRISPAHARREDHRDPSK